MSNPPFPDTEQYVAEPHAPDWPAFLDAADERLAWARMHEAQFRASLPEYKPLPWPFAAFTIGAVLVLAWVTVAAVVAGLHWVW